MKQSAGTLLYRTTDQGLEVLLVHAAGAYNRHAPWSIPKGLPDQGADFEETARRETFEETGVRPGLLAALGSIDYRKSRKRIHCFAGPAPASAAPVPDYLEVDKAEFVPLDRARQLLHPDQCDFLDMLVDELQRETSARKSNSGPSPLSTAP
jgi:predicted NUDIX family NTP pyrophosphohydrolase